MKKIFLIITFLATAHSLFAQKVKFILQGGMNLASISPNAPQSGGGGSQAQATFQFGGIIDIPLNAVSLQTGILLNGKGNFSTTTENFVSNGNPVPYSLRHLTNITYLELPVNIVYRHPVKPGSLYFGAGPYIARAVWGSYSTKASMNTYYKKVVSTDMSFGNGTDQLKSMDYGANILAGLQMKNGLKLGLNYGLGLTSITNTGSAQNRVLSLVVGYCF